MDGLRPAEGVGGQCPPYPAPAAERRFAFADEPVQVDADQRPGATRVAVAYQPCDDRACLPAVTRTIGV